jgi:hypothetical protein
MGELFTITPDIRNIAQTAFSDLIRELGKDCELHYEPSFVECENCHYDSQARRSDGIYKGGGPTPFARGMICPVCGGAGGLFTENTEVVKLLINKNPKQFQMVGQIRIDQVDMQAKGFLPDLPKIFRAKYIIAQVNLKPYIVEKYQLFGTPTDTSNIVQDQFFISSWKRV